MLLGALTGVIVALALTFGSIALLVSSLAEGVASLLKLRAATLLEGLKNILNAGGQSRSWLPWPHLTTSLPASGQAQGGGQAQGQGGPSNATLLENLLNHAAINPRGPGNNAQQSVSRGVRPSYIPPRQFAIALLDVIQTAPTGTPQSLQNAINALPDPQLKQYLLGVFNRASGDIRRMHDEIATWFDSAMDRVAGDYKRYTQFWSFVFGFAIAVALNIDALAIAQAVLTNPLLIDNVQLTATGDPAKSFQGMQLAGFPIGWPAWSFDQFWDHVGHALCARPGHSLTKLIGWTVTAIAALFGAPFWFDLLQRFVRLRGTGDPPPDPAAG